MKNKGYFVGIVSARKKANYMSKLEFGLVPGKENKQRFFSEINELIVASVLEPGLIDIQLYKNAHEKNSYFLVRHKMSLSFINFDYLV